jgi:hypothetical protein
MTSALIVTAAAVGWAIVLLQYLELRWEARERKKAERALERERGYTRALATQVHDLHSHNRRLERQERFRADAGRRQS